MDKKTFPSDAADKFVLRLPEGMREQIAEAAKSSGRSMNAEIVGRLAASFTSGGGSELLAHRMQLKDHLIRDQMGRAHHLRVALLWLAQSVMNLSKLKNPEELPERSRLLAAAARTYADDYSASATAIHPAMTEELLAAQREFVAIEKKRAEVDHLFKTLPLAEAVKLEVPSLFPPDDVPIPVEPTQPDSPTPKVKRMTMRRNLKE